ncbi:MAG: hypothetical protein AAFW69_08875, partial [Pseudomonadota bacterium]
MRPLTPILAALAIAALPFAAAAAEPIADRAAWLTEATGAIEAGDLTAFQAILDRTLGDEMHGDVMLTVMPLEQEMGAEPAVYVDKLAE